MSADGEVSNDNSNVFNGFTNCADDPARPAADEQRAAADDVADQSWCFTDLLIAPTRCIGITPAVDPLVIGPAAGAAPIVVIVVIVVIGNFGDPARQCERRLLGAGIGVRTWPDSGFPKPSRSVPGLVSATAGVVGAESSRAVRGQLAAVVHSGVGSSTGCPHGQPHQTHTVSRLVTHRQSGAQWKSWPAHCSPAPESSVLRTIVGIARRCDNLIVGGSNVSAGARRWSSGRITAARSRADCSQQSRCGWLKPSSRDE